MRATLAELAQLLEAEMEGDGQTEISGISALNEAKTGDLAFVAKDGSAAQRLAASHASAVLVAPDLPVDRPALRVPDPYLGFIRLVEAYFPQQHPAWGIDERAVLAPDVVVGQGVSVGPFAVIAEGSRLEDDVVVYPGTYVGPGCRIGAGCVLYANVSLYPRVTLGRGVVIHSGAVIGADGFGYRRLKDGNYRKIPQIGGVLIGDGVEIGANTCIDRATLGDTVVEAGAKLDNLVQIGHNSVVGASSVMAGQAGVSGSVRVGAKVRIGGQAGIADHVNIGDEASIAGQAGVAANVAPGATVFGTPAVPLTLAKRAHIYGLKLGKLFQSVKRLQRRLEALESRSEGK
jgi:UDP-3-O-[3-hydroxymyristoyl] glucosamine N-acyltransferase